MVPRQAVMLLGAPASGKSTLACCLQHEGWQLLSSELSVVSEQGLVWPGLYCQHQILLTARL